ncbi:unnamed protein product [Mycena citricolor]|uniref:Uncharacterized protein n=1 Tax=Mycena citricolor TaxID=2018698 RepID=A0AAD2HBU3_9AGAR|nr:unnamed protein product [Mycena citricolor]CAK5271909.1 unnamed protein product [Mycena citricolor]
MIYFASAAVSELNRVAFTLYNTTILHFSITPNSGLLPLSLNLQRHTVTSQTAMIFSRFSPTKALRRRIHRRSVGMSGADQDADSIEQLFVEHAEMTPPSTDAPQDVFEANSPFGFSNATPQAENAYKSRIHLQGSRYRLNRDRHLAGRPAIVPGMRRSAEPHSARTADRLVHRSTRCSIRPSSLRHILALAEPAIGEPDAAETPWLPTAEDETILASPAPSQPDTASTSTRSQPLPSPAREPFSSLLPQEPHYIAKPTPKRIKELQRLRFFDKENVHRSFIGGMRRPLS